MLDGGMVVLAIFTRNVAHPGLLLVGPDVDARPVKEEVMELEPESGKSSREVLMTLSAV